MAIYEGSPTLLTHAVDDMLYFNVSELSTDPDAAPGDNEVISFAKFKFKFKFKIQIQIQIRKHIKDQEIFSIIWVWFRNNTGNSEQWIISQER